MHDIAFGFQAAPASEVRKPDQALYREVMEDCALGHRLAYDAAWLLEHHFSDYYPTPSPLLLRKLTDPAELGPFMDSNLVGRPETVCRRIDQLAGLGFNYFMVSSATPGTPIELRQRMMSRFADEVCPRYSRTMQEKRAA